MAHKSQSSSWPSGTGLSDWTMRSDRSGGSSNLLKKLDELQQSHEDAERAGDVFIAELQRSAAEHRAQTTQLLSVLAAFGLNPTELGRVAKTAAADAARVRQARRGNETEDEIVFSGDVQKTASEARTERSLASEVRRVANRSSRLRKQVAALRKVVQTPLYLKTPESADVIEWKAETTQIEEKTKILRKKLDNLQVPTLFSLQKRHDECMALKSELTFAQERLKQFEGLPPSLAEATQKLEQAKRQLSTLQSEIKNCNASSFDLDY